VEGILIKVEIFTEQKLDRHAIWRLNDIIKYALEAEGISAVVYATEA
jgi:hypothetical protein